MRHFDMLEHVHSTFLLDVRDTIVPIALLKACQAFREMRTGETMEILVNDPDIRKDLFRVLPTSACELLDTREETSFSRFLLRKTT
jgi:TusA-related sulfurtransferase